MTRTVSGVSPEPEAGEVRLSLENSAMSEDLQGRLLDGLETFLQQELNILLHLHTAGEKAFQIKNKNYLVHIYVILKRLVFIITFIWISVNQVLKEFKDIRRFKIH